MDLRIPFDLKKAEAEAVASAKALIEKGLKNATTGIVDELFQHEQTYNGQLDRKEGFARTLIRQRIEEYAASEEFEAVIQDCIRKHADNAADHAVQKMLESASRKRVFTAVPHKGSPT